MTAPTAATQLPPVFDATEPSASLAAPVNTIEVQQKAQILCDALAQTLTRVQAAQAAAEAHYQRQMAACSAASQQIMEDTSLTPKQQEEKMAAVAQQTPSMPALTPLNPQDTRSFEALSFKFRAAAVNRRDDDALAILQQITDLAGKVHSDDVKMFLAEARLTYAAPPQDTPPSPISGDLSQGGLEQPVSQ